MWIEYYYQTPYQDYDLGPAFYESESDEELEAYKELLWRRFHIGTITDMRIVKKPSREFCEKELHILHLELESIQRRITMFEELLHDE